MDLIGDGGASPQLPDTWRRSLNASVNALRMQVTPENVLAVRGVLLAESDRLMVSVNRASGARGGVCGGDPVSRDARQAFGERVATLVAQARQYADELGRAGRSLDQIARNYGLTEQQIAASYQRVDPAGQA